MIVPAHGRGRFEPGQATAAADAVIRDRGKIVDTEEWTRKVELAFETNRHDNDRDDDLDHED